jgi:ABC-type branched-subunit amino acid transport system permease subunit
MSSYVLFLLLGLGSGAVYAILALGLVLKYRSAGVVDIAHGAVAMFIAYVYLGLRTSGSLEFPWIVIPHHVTVSHAPLHTLPAIVISLAYAAVLGLVLYVLIYRPLRTATPLTKVCASVGLMLFLQAVAILNYGTDARSTEAILPTSPINLAGVTAPSDRLWFAGIVMVIGLALTVIYRYTRFGLATRAAAENEKGAALAGLSANRLAAGNWVLATVLAGLGGILIAPISTVDPSSYTLFIVPALGVALVARFSSFAVAIVAGLMLGMAQSVITKLLLVWPWLPQQGLPEALPFVVIIIAMTVLTRGLGARGERAEQHNPSLGRPESPLRTTAACFAIGLALLFVLHGSLRSAMIASLIWICICLSLTVLTGYIGQVSLAQMSFAGIGGFMVSHFTVGAHIGFPFSLLLAALCAVPLGLLVGLPALRLRGVNLAVVTLAAAAAIDALLFNGSWFSGGLGGSKVTSPSLLGWDLGIAKGHAYPRVIFGAMVLVIVCAIGYVVARLRNAPAGRMLIAVRSNERAAASVGIEVPRAKLFAFALSAFIAGIGGGLLAYQQGNVSPASFDVFESLGLLAIAYVAGVGRISGAVAAGIMFSSTGVVVTGLDNHLGVGKYQTLVAGLALMLTAIGNPDGVMSTTAKGGPAVVFFRARAALRRRISAWRAGPAGADVERAP